MKPDITSQILGKIKSQNLKPKPKIYFIVGNVIFWMFYVMSIIIGSLGVGIIITFIGGDDIFLIQRVGLLFLLEKYVPIFWLIFLLGSVITGLVFLKKTQNGYKHMFSKIILFNIILTFVLGSILFASGFSTKSDETLRNYFHTYSSLFVPDREKRMKEVWQNEEKGLLLGEIILLGSGNLDLQDTNNKIWKIDISKAEIKKKVVLLTGNKIKIIGNKMGENFFHALQIRPYMGMNH